MKMKCMVALGELTAPSNYGGIARTATGLDEKEKMEVSLSV
jgi:tRNA G18 (ribose-2'-O)-methylase SpoU